MNGMVASGSRRTPPPDGLTEYATSRYRFGLVSVANTIRPDPTARGDETNTRAETTTPNPRARRTVLYDSALRNHVPVIRTCTLAQPTSRTTHATLKRSRT